MRFANELGSLLFNGVLEVVAAKPSTFANKLNTESSDTYPVVSGILWRGFFLSEVNRSLKFNHRFCSHKCHLLFWFDFVALT